jgi:hypothetical protein
MGKCLLICFLLFGSSRLFACDCSYQGDFLTVAPSTNLVALVKVNRYLTFQDPDKQLFPLSMEVEIIQIYKGTETRKTVVVWGDNGMLCRPPLSRFRLNGYYVIAFDSKTRITESPSSYSISDCGAFWLSVDFENKQAFGDVTKDLRQISLPEIEIILAGR